MNWWIFFGITGSWCLGLFVGWVNWNTTSTEPTPAEPHCLDEVPTHQWGKWDEKLDRYLNDHRDYDYVQIRSCTLCGIKQRRKLELR